jgi:hypothetical protein
MSAGSGHGVIAVTTLIRLRWLVPAVLTAALVVPGTALGAGVPNPVVWGPIQGGIRGFPGNASTYPLSGPGYDYTENEYFFSGTATNLSNGLTASYVTRMLVRVPRDPAKFNGILLVDWPNVTDQEDFEFTWWAPAHTYLMQQGYGYAIISAQQVGVNHLKLWDPARYALLSHPGDSYAQDMFAQGIKALRDPQDNGTSPQYPNVVDPTGGLHVRYVVAGGVSQSAGELATFINNGYNRGWSTRTTSSATSVAPTTISPRSSSQWTKKRVSRARPLRRANPTILTSECGKRPGRPMSRSVGGHTG